MQAFHAVYDTADDVQLTGFRQRGGKLMFFHGLADPIFSAQEMADYQRRLNDPPGNAEPALVRLAARGALQRRAGGQRRRLQLPLRERRAGP